VNASVLHHLSLVKDSAHLWGNLIIRLTLLLLPLRGWRGKQRLPCSPGNGSGSGPNPTYSKWPDKL